MLFYVTQSLLNVANLLDTLSTKNPYNQIFVSNVLTCEINSTSLLMTFPNIEMLKKLFEQRKEAMTLDVKEVSGLELSYRFSPFKHPFLPLPASNSKYKNYLAVITLQQGTIICVVIKKTGLFEVFEKGVKPETVIIEKLRTHNTPLQLFALLEGLFLKLLPVLREEWCYLHPVFVFLNYENMFLQKLITERVFDEIEKKHQVKNIRRFVGSPCFSLLDYQKFLEA